LRDSHRTIGHTRRAFEVLDFHRRSDATIAEVDRSVHVAMRNGSTRPCLLDLRSTHGNRCACSIESITQLTYVVLKQHFAAPHSITATLVHTKHGPSDLRPQRRFTLGCDTPCSHGRDQIANATELDAVYSHVDRLHGSILVRTCAKEGSSTECR
jgi:hypothetical protein